MKTNLIRWLVCCCCGSHTLGRQWWNRDQGFGLCPSCWRTHYQHEPNSCGVKGYHFAIRIPKDELIKNWRRYKVLAKK